MKKTNRKNKTNLVVNWPTGFFIMEPAEEHPNIQSLTGFNPEFVPITLRVRLNNAIEDKHTTKIGTLKNAKGRPKLVFATVPVSTDTIEAAKAAGVLVESDVISTVNVVDIKSSNQTETATVSDEVTHEDTAAVPSV